MNTISILAVAVLSIFPAFTMASEMVPFTIPVDVPADSEIAMPYQPLTEQGRLHAKEQHFYTTSGERVRLWGVNLSFAANFPTHEDAKRIAKRMAAFGINSVRCHHMDTANWPRGIWDESGKDLHPEAVDRLDYFIDQLARHGIYTDINLHVGKSHSRTLGLPKAPRDYDKMVNLFTPELIQAQKEYARKLLTHRNKYRNNVTYAQDYAVAIVEITNENSLFMWGADNTLRTLPEFYADILQKQYNQWLKDKYGTNEKLRKVWSKDAEPMGNKNLLQSSIPKDGWQLEQHGQARAEISVQGRDVFSGLKIDIKNIDGTDWHLQYNHRELKFEQGRYYTVSFKARAVKEREMTVNVGQAHEPWGNLGLSRTVKLTPQWQTFTMGFFAAQDDDNSRLNFSFGRNDGDIELGIVELHTGGQVAILPDESLEKASVRLFADRETKARSVDRMVFLAETEKKYFDGMREYIKQDLGCEALVTGTIVFGPLGLYAQSDMDFIDSHAYWQHPRFPNRSWDPGDWVIEQKAMSDYPQEGTLYQLAAKRLAGKPFTVTEYNHPAPLDSQAECVPMIASFAAAQDWDGVWLYTYSHSNDNWDRQKLNSYFDIDTNSAKWGFIPAGALIFREQLFPPRKFKMVDSLTDSSSVSIDAIAQAHLDHDRNMFSSLNNNDDDYTHRIIFRTLEKQSEESDTLYNPKVTVLHRPVFWWEDGLYLMKNDKTWVATGNMEHLNQLIPDYTHVHFDIQSPASATVTITPLDGKDLHQSRRILITACGRCENTGMRFSEDRQTVGRNWGTAPVLIEPIEGAVYLKETPFLENAKTACKILHPDGTVKDQFPVENGMILLKAEYGTMWYLIER